MKCQKCGSEWKTQSNIQVKVCPFCGQQLYLESPDTVKTVMRWIVQNKGIEAFQDASLINAYLSDLATKDETGRKRIKIALSSGVGNDFYRFYVRTKGSIGDREIRMLYVQMQKDGFSGEFSEFVINTFLYSISRPEAHFPNAEKDVNVFTVDKPYNYVESEQALKTQLSELAERGEPDAQFQLARKYETGDGLPKDYQKALQWYQKAANQGNSDAQNSIGQMIASGRYRQDYQDTASWCRTTIDLKKDYEVAAQWYHVAAKQGNASAQSNLGHMYELGRGVPQDDREAVKWYRMAAEQGNVDAQYNLGHMYRSGRGVRQDYREALKWYQKAAYQGDRSAQMKVDELKAKIRMGK